MFTLLRVDVSTLLGHHQGDSCIIHKHHYTGLRVCYKVYIATCCVFGWCLTYLCNPVHGHATYKMYLQTLFQPQRPNSAVFTQTRLLIMFRKIICIPCEKCIKHENSLRGLRSEIFNVTSVRINRNK